MLKFFFKSRQSKNEDIPFDKQQDPYLENLILNLELQKKQQPVILTEQQKEKEIK